LKVFSYCSGREFYEDDAIMRGVLVASPELDSQAADDQKFRHIPTLRVLAFSRRADLMEANRKIAKHRRISIFDTK
jgi:hypothetical protein